MGIKYLWDTNTAIYYLKQQFPRSAEIFIDGRMVGVMNGHNITLGAPEKNYFKFGIYLHGTRATELITPAHAYFSGLGKSDARTGLSK